MKEFFSSGYSPSLKKEVEYALSSPPPAADDKDQDVELFYRLVNKWQGRGEMKKDLKYNPTRLLEQFFVNFWK